MLSIENLSKKFNDNSGFKFGPVDLEMGKEIVVALGEIGSGKTTLLNLISGIMKPNTGKIFFKEKNLDLNEISIEKRNIGYIFQKLFLFPHLNVLDNIQFGLNRFQKRGKNDETNCWLKDLITILKIQPLLYRNIETLSGGQQQKVALARTLAVKPDILLLDEPLASLDVISKIELIQDLKIIFTQMQIPIIYVTHYPKEAFSLADRIIILNNGKIVEDGSSKEVMLNPKTKFAKFLIENL